MRVWDLPVHLLCNKHLIAQHHEIHCIASIMVKHICGEKYGFASHPEVRRWLEHQLPTLTLNAKHSETAVEMLDRGMNHHYQNDKAGMHSWASDNHPSYPGPWQSIPDQIALLKSKGCKCKVDEMLMLKQEVK